MCKYLGVFPACRFLDGAPRNAKLRLSLQQQPANRGRSAYKDSEVEEGSANQDFKDQDAHSQSVELSTEAEGIHFYGRDFGI